jgi:hypothetical protein
MAESNEAAIDLTLLSEPRLDFRYGQKLVDPHTGLALFGPFDADDPAHPKSISYAVIGAPEGLASFEEFSKALAGPIVSQEYGDPSHLAKAKLLWPPFPGFEAAFATAWPIQASFSEALDRTKLLEASRLRDPNRRAHAVVDFYVQVIDRLKERDERFDVVLCIVPDQIWKNCRPKSVVQDGIGRSPSLRERSVRRVQSDLFATYSTQEYEHSVDFRRQLKARVMAAGIPVQIVRESTLRIAPSNDPHDRGLTVLSDRAWNLSTAIYYKAGGKPWRLATAREGVCYVGMAFRRTDPSDIQSGTACCAAQMFLDTGDGVVFRGEFGPWYSPQTKEYHLSETSAHDLLKGVLQAYTDQGGKNLKEIFLHSRSTIDAAEFSGYARACPPGVKLVGVRVRKDSTTKLYREGKWPVVRGTFWKVDDRSGYLWASGFKASVLSYDGWEMPVPLRIDIEHGEASVELVARDILGLTKLNYNACKIGDAAPVTVGFSDAVGEILVSNPTIKNPRPNFKFYI